MDEEKKERKIRRFIQRLEIFNRTVDELLKESEFIKWISNNKLGTLILFKEKTTKFSYPPKESFKAFILTYRLFIQDKDGVSLRSMKELYDRLPIAEKAKKDFYAVRNQINKYLDSKPSFRISGFDMTTNREIQNVIIYGGFAHYRKKYQKKFELWTKKETYWNEIFIYFCAILFYIFEGLVLIKKINGDIIKELRKL